MKLLTKELQKQLPTCDDFVDDSNPMIYAKFFTPDSGWTWFVAAGQQEDDDYLFYGFVIGPFPEWGHFPLKELQSVQGAIGLPVERDLHFKPARWNVVKDRYRIKE